VANLEMKKGLAEAEPFISLELKGNRTLDTRIFNPYLESYGLQDTFVVPPLLTTLEARQTLFVAITNFSNVEILHNPRCFVG
jgi:hypothetical protein